MGKVVSLNISEKEELKKFKFPQLMLLKNLVLRGMHMQEIGIGR